MENVLRIVIPRVRIGVLLGHNGEIKKKIETILEVKLRVDSEGGNVEIFSDSDPTKLIRAREIAKAIGRGFSPDRAFALMNEEKLLEVIDLRETFGRNNGDIKRVKGRIIGRDGKTRRLLEEFTETNISIYGHTISTIGDYESIFFAREAIRMLLSGKQHSTVYKFLMRKRRERKKIQKTELWEKIE
jgi:ribosomal RNA assembly protein